jgi:4a-hydroxytetrahydrobiopterin dehydratase
MVPVSGSETSKSRKMSDLKDKHCVPMEEGSKALNSGQINRFKKMLEPGWRVIENQKLHKDFPFDNFNQGMAFARDIALLADKETHHPDLCIHYTRVEVELSTHDLGGLSENDFILAAKIDEL